MAATDQSMVMYRSVDRDGGEQASAWCRILALFSLFRRQYRGAENYRLSGSQCVGNRVLIDLILIGLFAHQHGFMARPGFKER